MSINRPAAESPAVLYLFVAGSHPTSLRAREVLAETLQEQNIAIETRVVDVFEDAKTAVAAGAIATPSLLAADGDRRLWLIGDLVDRDALRSFLTSFLEGAGHVASGENADGLGRSR